MVAPAIAAAAGWPVTPCAAGGGAETCVGSGKARRPVIARRGVGDVLDRRLGVRDGLDGFEEAVEIARGGRDAADARTAPGRELRSCRRAAARKWSELVLPQVEQPGE